jgi:hypothetical protein
VKSMKPNVWVGNQRNPDDRLKLTVSETDREAINATHGHINQRITVTDIPTGKHYILRRASCELPRCACALALVKEVQS